MSAQLLPRRSFHRLAGSALAALAGGTLHAAPAPVAHFYYYDGTSLASLRANAASIQRLSPVWFHVDATGRVEDRSDRALASFCATQRIDLHPLVVNRDFQPSIATAILRDVRAQERVVTQLRALAARHRLHGIQLDFEQIPPEHKAAYTRLAQRAAEELHRDNRQLTVAVGAPLAPSSDAPRYPRGPHADSFDYLKLAQAADSLTLMAYDEHAAPGHPGPIAGLPWVEACVRKTLEYVPPAKLFLGLPLYYRSWAGANVLDGPTPDAVALAAKLKITPELHPTELEASFQTPGPQPRTFWLSEPRGLRRKLDLVARYNLAGFSAWRLGQEDPLVWRELFRPGSSPRAALLSLRESFHALP